MASISATRRTLASLVARALYSPPSPLLRRPSSYRHSLALLDKLPQLASTIPSRFKSSGEAPVKQPSSRSRSRDPKDTPLVDGCDYEHWLVIMEFPDPKPSEEEMVGAYVKALAEIVGSEEEAKKKIYSVSTRAYTGFGALISEEVSSKIKAVPGVLWVLPDSYLDATNKDYGGDLFVDGKVIHRPQFWYQASPSTTSPQANPSARPRGNSRRQSMQQPLSMDGQNVAQNGGETSRN